jgi:hypothetical protein
MTRRSILLAVVVSPIAAVAGTDTVSPRNAMAKAANVFTAQFRRWADAFNKLGPDAHWDVPEAEGFEPLEKMLGRVRHLRREWLKDY